MQGQGVSDLAVTASKNALDHAGVDGADIDLVSRTIILILLDIGAVVLIAACHETYYTPGN